SYASVILNTSAPPFDQKAARQAVAAGIDRAEILKTVFYDTGTIAYGPVPPTVFSYDKSFQPWQYNVGKAKEILAALNAPSCLSFTMEVTSGSPATIQLAQLIKDQLGKAGITMEIQQLEFAKILEDQASGNFQATLIGWSGRIDPDGNMYNMVHTGSAL